LRSSDLSLDFFKVRCCFLLQLRGHFSGIVDAEPRSYTTKSSGEIDHRTQEALLIINSLMLEGHTEVVCDVLSESV
jgi:hypothetical protein